MNDNIKKIIICVWMTILAAFLLYYPLKASNAEQFSKEENRMLAQLEDFNAENVFSGRFEDATEDFLLDRFNDRNQVLSFVNKLKDCLSIATYEDSLYVAQNAPKDALTGDISKDDYQKLLEELGKKPTDKPANPTNVPSEAPSLTPPVTPGGNTPSETPTPSLSPTPAENPPIEPKQPAQIDDFPLYPGLYATVNGQKTTLQTFDRSVVLGVTAVLNRYASLLPENGKLMYATVPSTEWWRRQVAMDGEKSFEFDYDEIVNGLGADNVYAFDTVNILSDDINRGNYVVFRTDMHWNARGAYLVYCELVKRAGKTCADFDKDFNHYFEDNFLGTLYRDNPSDYFRKNADVLELVEPVYPSTVYRIVDKNTIKEISFLDYNAPASDRYTIFLGGPGGPWTYIESDNGETENCLVLMDSFGLSLIPFLTKNYKQVHYYDPRYYDYNKVGYTVAEMIEKYNIQDIYVICSSYHSFDTTFIVKDASFQLNNQ